MNVILPQPLDSADAMEERLREIGATRYHSLHPFHHLLHSGQLTRGQVQAWALNRYYYQSSIPLKDAAVISRFRDRAVRLEWRHRLDDHDGAEGAEGGIDRWLILTDGLGLDRDYVESAVGILPATRFAVDAYVTFVREKSPLEAVASSLTELFAPDLHKTRIAALLEHYPFANEKTLVYFRTRLVQAPDDVAYGLDYVMREAKTPDQQEQCLAALRFKTDVLWAQLDALHYAYVKPGHIPPGAFVPKDRQ